MDNSAPLLEAQMLSHGKQRGTGTAGIALGAPERHIENEEILARLGNEEDTSGWQTQTTSRYGGTESAPGGTPGSRDDLISLLDVIIAGSRKITHAKSGTF